jgi:predicted transglutaminase-like cysteine proteinase
MCLLQTQNVIIASLQNIPVIANVLKGSINFAAAAIYILYVAILFIVIYLIFKYIVVKALYVYKDTEIEPGILLSKFNRGQKSIDTAANACIILVLMAHIFFKVFDIKIIVLSALCLIFVFRKLRVKEVKKIKKNDKQLEKEEEANTINSLSYEWQYNTDPLGIQQPVRFNVTLSISDARYTEYQAKEHLDNSPAALRRYVLDGICTEVIELAQQIKKQCVARNLNTFHQASAVMAFQQSLKYVYDLDSKGNEEYIRYPLETLVDKEGDCDCHGICSAAILYSMGYDVVLLRIIFPEGDGHLAIAVQGADGIPGNFFELNGRSYYYCEVTPFEGNSMSFRVGEMKEMPGANITVVPVKEIVNNL